MLTQEDIKNRLEAIEQFIDSGKYKNYKNWKQNPLKIEYYWIHQPKNKSYLTNDLKFKLDEISFFEYKTTNSSCPYPIRDGHRWCKHCKNEFEIKLFGLGKNI